jgi:hypothetical protein
VGPLAGTYIQCSSNVGSYPNYDCIPHYINGTYDVLVEINQTADSTPSLTVKAVYGGHVITQPEEVAKAIVGAISIEKPLNLDMLLAMRLLVIRSKKKYAIFRVPKDDNTKYHTIVCISSHARHLSKVKCLCT